MFVVGGFGFISIVIVIIINSYCFYFIVTVIIVVVVAIFLLMFLLLLTVVVGLHTIVLARCLLVFNDSVLAFVGFVYCFSVVLSPMGHAYCFLQNDLSKAQCNSHFQLRSAHHDLNLTKIPRSF